MSFATPPGTALPRLLARLAPAVFAALLVVLPACEAAMQDAVALPGADDEAAAPPEPGRGDDGGVCYENGAGQCVVATAGCDPNTITGSAVERCATCETGGTDVEICGASTTARCFDLDQGGLCQRCVTDSGEVLYDDCAAGADDLSSLTCEPVSYDSDEDTTCEVCRDDNGYVITQSCRPNAATCIDVVRSGRLCEECFTETGELAYRECEAPDLDPRVCEAYGGFSGQCVDCYGADDELLSHQCTLGIGLDGGASAPGESSSSYCDQVLDPSGRSCERCYSSTGSLISETCVDDAAYSPARCEELRFTYQVCLVCVDDTGAESLTQCQSTTSACADPASCPPPPCTNRYLDDGTLCRTCPTSTAGETESRCMSGGDLLCDVQDEYSETPPADSESDPGVVNEVCTVCTVSGEVVYSPCSTDGTVPPQPVCSPTTTADNVSCEVCVDPATGEEIYTSCPEAAPPPQQSEACLETTGVPLTGASGQQLYLPAEGAAEPDAAVADCVLCSPSGNAGDPANTGGCLMQHECTSSGTDASVCEERTAVLYDPTQCAEPWGDATGSGALVAAMAWLLEQHGVVVYALDDEGVSPDFTGACEGCDCPRGDRYTFEVSAEDAALLLNLGLGFYAP